MKSVTKISNVSLIGILFSTLIICSSIPVLAQSLFNRNDNYDFRGDHYLSAGGSTPDNFNLFIESDSDFRKFKLHIKKSRLHLGPYWLAWQYRVDMNNDGTWEQGWTTSDEMTVSYYYPNPPNGISANHTIKIEIQYQENPCCWTVNRTRYNQITTFSTPRVYVDSDNNSFIQLRDEDATAKIPVLMVEGFDPLNEKFPDTYYNLTWYLINTDLYPNGYEVFILNFNDGGRDLRLNADVLLKAIVKIHAISPNYKIVVAGLSMGGPITRYALAKKEGQSGTHNVGLFLSYDSPQDGAHISPGLQDWIKIQDPNEGAIGLMQANLQSVAAKQMLRYNTYDPSHIFRNEFYNELNGLNGDGYPHQSYNVSVSNGNLEATWGYESEGRHLMTLKINDNLIYDVSAVKLDLGTGSKFTDLTMKRYGDIFSSPFINIYYELEIIFNPAYTPTWSALDLVNPQINPITGDITSFEYSKFDDYVFQPDPLMHHELSTLSRNTIMDWLDKDFNITVNYNLPEGGSASPDNYQVNILHGIPIIVQPKIINVNGKQITYNFFEWEDGNTNNPRTFYTSHDVSYTANMKGTQVSNDPNAYSTNSQRKFVRTDNGYLHNVYESTGKAWYEISTDNGSSWQIANNGQPLSGSKESKLPAIDYRGDYVVIVWQQEDVGAYDIILAKFFAGTYQQGATIFMDIYLPYSSQTNPVISWDGEGRILFMWKRGEDNVGYWPTGIVFSYGALSGFGWNEMDFDVIPTTNSNSINPTLVADKDNTLNPAEYHLAWEQPAGFNTYVKYFKLSRDGDNQIQTQPPLSPEIPSSGAGFWTNRKPSIIVVDDHTPRLAWIGYTPWYGSRTVFRAKQTNGLWSSTIYNYGSYSTESVNINRTDDNNYAFAYSELSYPDDYPNKYVKNSNLWEMLNLGTTGKDIQVSNAANFYSMYCLAFQSNVTLPYRFVQSSSFGYLQKPTKKTESIGRAAIVTKDSTEFIYALGDVLLNDEPIKFKDVKDTIQINSQQELNNYLKSKPFHLDDGLALTFSVVSGVVNPGIAAMLLEEGKYVKFKVELIKDKTGEILNSFAILEYNANNVEELTNLSFSLNTNGMSKTKVHLKILLDENISGEYTLSELIAADSVLHIGKEGYQEVSFGGDLAVKEYALEQNYPNPFNPSTTLKYQIPQNGFVTLKVYDILGKEVATLVNEVKASGRYEVNFNASSLASGVYLYILNVNDYVNVKKMLLLK